MPLAGGMLAMCSPRRAEHCLSRSSPVHRLVTGADSQRGVFRARWPVRERGRLACRSCYHPRAHGRGSRRRSVVPAIPGRHGRRPAEPVMTQPGRRGARHSVRRAQVCAAGIPLLILSAASCSSPSPRPNPTGIIVGVVVPCTSGITGTLPPGLTRIVTVEKSGRVVKRRLVSRRFISDSQSPRYLPCAYGRPCVSQCPGKAEADSPGTTSRTMR